MQILVNMAMDGWSTANGQVMYLFSCRSPISSLKCYHRVITLSALGKEFLSVQIHLNKVVTLRSFASIPGIRFGDMQILHWTRHVGGSVISKTFLNSILIKYN